MNLGMAVVAGSDAILCACCQNLLRFNLAVIPAFFLKTGLQETAPAAAAEIVGSIRRHVDEVFFTHHRFYNITEVFSYRVAKGFSYQLTGILNGKFNLPVLVPV
jgi:hypothetical protein